MRISFFVYVTKMHIEADKMLHLLVSLARKMFMFMNFDAVIIEDSSALFTTALC